MNVFSLAAKKAVTNLLLVLLGFIVSAVGFVPNIDFQALVKEKTAQATEFLTELFGLNVEDETAILAFVEKWRPKPQVQLQPEMTLIDAANVIKAKFPNPEIGAAMADVILAINSDISPVVTEFPRDIRV